MQHGEIGRSAVGCCRKTHKKMRVMLNWKIIYRTMARPALVYGAETCSTMKSQEQRLDVNDMRVLLLWMCGVTKTDEIRNYYVRGSVKVANAKVVRTC